MKSFMTTLICPDCTHDDFELVGEPDLQPMSGTGKYRCKNCGVELTLWVQIIRTRRKKAT